MVDSIAPGRQFNQLTAISLALRECFRPDDVYMSVTVRHPLGSGVYLNVTTRYSIRAGVYVTATRGHVRSNGVFDRHTLGFQSHQVVSAVQSCI
jgi:hypothetical protein